MFRILVTETNDLVQDNIPTYDEAWEIIQQLPSKDSALKIEEYVIPITGLGRDPDLHL